MIKESCAPLNNRKRPSPPIDVHAALRRTNPKTAHPQERGPKAPASSPTIELPVASK
jgi:hypothetical protein